MKWKRVVATMSAGLAAAIVTRWIFDTASNRPFDLGNAVFIGVAVSAGVVAATWNQYRKQGREKAGTDG